MKFLNKKIELMAPAGSRGAFLAAINAGADSVYLGLQELNARRKAKNFSIPELGDLIDFAHSKKRKVYVTLNTLIKENELETLINYLNALQFIKVDAVIIQDIGILEIIKRFFPKINVHASTQMAIHNSKGLQWAESVGIKRVILPRELSSAELKQIRKSTDIELEIFCHGAMCYSYSGLCLYSSFLGGASANRGLCAQPCRRDYNLDEQSITPFSMKDLCLINHIPDIMDSGIDALKIEGRLRSENYAETATRAYRMVIDETWKNKNKKNINNVIRETINEANLLLKHDLARIKHTGYFYNTNNLILTSGNAQTGNFIGKIKSIVTRGAIISTSQEINKGDFLRIRWDKDKSNIFKVTFARKVKNTPDLIKINIPKFCEPEMELYRVEFSKQIKISSKLDVPHKEFNIPSAKFILNKLKIKKNIQSKKAQQKDTAFYMQFDNPGLIKFHELKFFKKWIFNLNFKSVLKNRIPGLDKKFYSSLQFSLPEIIPENLLNKYSSIISSLINKGYRDFYISNIGQLPLFRNKKVKLYTNSTVYLLNRFAGKFLKQNNIKKSVVLLEGGFSDYKQLLNFAGTPECIITVFCYPLLFLSKTISSNCINKNLIDDKANKIKTFYDGVFYRTISAKPFSLLRRINQLKNENFNIFMIDLRNTISNRKEINKIIKYILTPELLKDYKIFNFKTSVR